MSVTINGTTGIAGVDGSASTPAVQGTDTNTGIFFPAADTIAFGEGGAEAMRITSSAELLIGTTTAASTQGANLQVITAAAIRRNVASAGSGALRFEKSRSATDGGYTIVQNDDNLGEVQFYGADGVDYAVAATIKGLVNGTPGSDDMPGALVFSTTADGSATVTERARITSGGYFKASNAGTYDGATDAYHEFRQTAANVGLYMTSTNASLASPMIQQVATRAASDQYQFMRCYSNLGTDTEILLRGDGNGYADGTWNNNGADYAEFFESANGQALTLGSTVVLDGNKVREATDQDPASEIFGVVRPKEPSKASMVVGNTAWNKWANKYLTDDFDRYIMEDHNVVEWTDADGKEHSYESHNIPAEVTVPSDAVTKTHDSNGNKFQHYKLNPSWDKDAEYVNRENRPEWNIIGLLGQVKILKGQPVGDRWIKMRDVSATVEEWMVR